MMQNSNRAFIFYAITIALAILVAMAVPFIGEASLPVTMLTPTIAAVIMLSLVSREGSFSEVAALLGLALEYL